MIGKRIKHYLIVEKIGEGGMGVVYRAHDERLDRDVALKFLPPDFSASEELKVRFEQEAKAASALDHQNICTIHAIEKTDEGRLFIVMAYYEGETVKTKVKQGPLPMEEIVRLASQIAQGLYAAHERGILHMDVKPANLMVTRDGTVKILDFGLSKFMSELDHSGSVGPLMGTVAYMSPERVQAKQTGPESDIWSLGVVLYEMATGERPFPGSNDMSVLYSIVHRDVAPAIDKIGDLPVELDKLIRRSLVKDPRYRYGSIEEFYADLELLRHVAQISDSIPGLPHHGLPQERRSRLTSVLVASVLALVLLYILSGLLLPTLPGKVLTLELRNLTNDPDLDWMSGLPAVLAEELPQEDGAEEGEAGDGEGERTKLDWIPPSDPLPVDDVLAALDPKNCFDDEQLEKIRRDTGADMVLTGFFRARTDEDRPVPTAGPIDEIRFEITVLLQDTETGRCYDYPLKATLSELPDKIMDLAGDLKKRLGVEPMSERESVIPQPKLGVTAEQLLAEAWKSMRTEDSVKAREHLLQAMEMTTGQSLLLNLELARAEVLLGYKPRALEHADTAVRLAEGTPLRDRLEIHAVHLETRRDFAAAAVFLRLQEFTVTDGDPAAAGAALSGKEREFWIDRQVRLAQVLVRAGQMQAARDVIDSVLDVEPEELRVLVIKAAAVGDWSESSMLTHKVVELAEERGARLLAARARNLEGHALWRLGNLEEAAEVILEAIEIYQEAGHEHGEADALTLLGNVRFEELDLAAAEECYDEATSLFVKLGNQVMETRNLVNKALVLRLGGYLNAALEVFESALGRYKDIGDEAGEVTTLINYADVLLLLGRVEDVESTYLTIAEILDLTSRASPRAEFHSAQGHFRALKGDLGALLELGEAQELYEESEEMPELALVLTREARIHHRQGDPAEALELYERASDLLEEASDTPSPIYIAEVRQGLGEALLAQNRIDEAREVFVALKEDMESVPQLFSEIQLSYAALLIEDGRPEEAESEARLALTGLEPRGALLAVALGQGILARSLAAQERWDDAELELDRAYAELPPTLMAYRLPLDILAARILVQRGDVKTARVNLEVLMSETRTHVFTELNLEIELAIAEIDILNGSSPDATQLGSIELKARSKGFILIAEKAARRLASDH